jgi:hypothetical protein
MELHVSTPDATPRPPNELSRRDVLLGGLFLGGLMLSGCGSQNAGLPGPRYPFEGGTGPELVRNQPAVMPPAAPQPVQPAQIELPRGIVSRSQWTRAGLYPRRETNPMNGISRITVHHDAIVSTDLRSTADVARRIESIRRSHIQNGWADIGYHYLIDPSGRIWEGRTTALQGAHVKENNEHNLGIVMLGNFDVHAPSPAATLALERFLASRMQSYRVPIVRVYTHREIKPTACPGSRLQRFMIATRGRGGNLLSMAT